jgi:hypothetical protein
MAALATRCNAAIVIVSADAIARLMDGGGRWNVIRRAG